MKYGFLGFGLMMFGMMGLVIITMFESITLDNDTEYYTLKEAMKASMYESIDWTYYSNNYIGTIHDPDGKTIREGRRYVGDVKIIEQKFVENFSKRFAKSIGGDADDYDVEFFDIMEKPPKASIKITGKTKAYTLVSGEGNDLNIVNNLSGILEINSTK